MPPPTEIQAGGGGGGGGSVAVADGGQQQPQQEQKSLGQTVVGIIRVAVFWYFISRFLFSSRKPSSSEPAIQMSNLFQKGVSLDMWLYLSERLSKKSSAILAIRNLLFGKRQTFLMLFADLIVPGLFH